MSMIERPGFSEWIEGSAFVDGEGVPIVMYHGTDTGSDFNIFALTNEASIGFHFGDYQAAQKRIDTISILEEDPGYWGAVVPVVCNARNPLRLTDHFTWELGNVCNELYDLGVVDDDQRDYVLESCSEYALFAAVELAGYDCIVYLNQTEHDGAPADSLLVWRAEQLKSPYSARFDRGVPGLVSGIPHDPNDFKCWESIKEELDSHKEALLDLMSAPQSAIGTAIPGF